MSERVLAQALFSALLATSLFGSVAVRAESVDFDDFPAYDDPAKLLTDEYADLGLHFFSSGSVWSGVSEGDPGGWNLEGSEGPSFLGIDAPVFNFVMRFDWPVSALSFDAARSAAGPDASLMAFAYRDNTFVELVSMPLPAGTSDWHRIEMHEDLDTLVVLGFGSIPYGIDALEWNGPLGEAEPELIEVAIDIRPGSDRNPIRPGGRGVLPVVLYGDDGFDVATVDRESLGFGPGMAPPIHKNGPHEEDYDGDGHVDLVIHVDVMSTGIAAQDPEACLEGETPEGPFYGCDLVTPVGRR